MSRLGQLLCARGLITSEQLEEALGHQAVQGARLGSNLVELGFLSIEQLAESLSELHKVPLPKREWLEKPQRAATQRVTRPLVERIRFIPMRLENKVLHAALLDPRHPNVLDDLRFATGCRIQPYVLPEIWMHDWLLELFDIPRGMRHVEIPEQTGQSTTPSAMRPQFNAHMPDAPPMFETTAMTNAQAANAAAAAEARRIARMAPAEPRTGSHARRAPSAPQTQAEPKRAANAPPPQADPKRAAGAALAQVELKRAASTPKPGEPGRAPSAPLPAEARPSRAQAADTSPGTSVAPEARASKPQPPPAPAAARAASIAPATSAAGSVRPPSIRVRARGPLSAIEETSWALPLPPPPAIAEPTAIEPPASLHEGEPEDPELSLVHDTESPPPMLEPMAVARELSHWESELAQAADRERLIELSFSIAGCFATRVALFTVLQGKVQGLRYLERGTTHPLDGVLFPPETASMLTEAATRAEARRADPRTREADVQLRKLLCDEDAVEVALFPVAIKQRVVNVLYASNGPEPLGPVAFGALEKLAEEMGLAYGRLILARKAGGG